MIKQTIRKTVAITILQLKEKRLLQLRNRRYLKSEFGGIMVILPVKLYLRRNAENFFPHLSPETLSDTTE